MGAALCSFPATALGATATATGTLTGSTLSLTTSAAPTFSANLNAGDSTPTYTVPLTIQDTRGTGAGWNATITSTQFSTGGATPDTLATNASTLTGVTSACTGGTCTNPTNAITYPVAVPAAATPQPRSNSSTPPPAPVWGNSRTRQRSPFSFPKAASPAPTPAR